MLNQYKKIELDKNKITNQLLSISELAKKNDWVFDYDKEIDELTFGLDTMPRNSFLFNINNEINLFVTPNSKINGIFIEYFAQNYIEHKREFKPILRVIEHEAKRQKIKTIDKDVIVTGFENTIAIEALKTLAAKRKLVSAV
ncbi:MAG TPA: hypothetical protein VF817_01630 [Patescibacteria group bacterium]